MREIEPDEMDVMAVLEIETDALGTFKLASLRRTPSDEVWTWKPLNTVFTHWLAIENLAGGRDMYPERDLLTSKQLEKLAADFVYYLEALNNIMAAVTIEL